MKPLGIILVGLGPASQPHLQSLAELTDRSEIRCAVCRPPESARRHGQTYPFPVTADLDRALSDPLAEVALVLTPAGTHRDIAIACLKAGKHVLVEKPLDVSLSRAEDLVFFAETAGLRFGVVLQHRFRPGARTLQKLLSEGELGEIQTASVRVPWWRPQSYYDEPGRGTLARDGGGVLLTQAIHAIDLFRAFVGVSEISAAAVRTTALHRMETEDYAAALVRLGNGAPGLIEATTAMYPGLPERIEIIGTKATAVLSGGTLKVSFLDGRTVEEAG